MKQLFILILISLLSNCNNKTRIVKIDSSFRKIDSVFIKNDSAIFIVNGDSFRIPLDSLISRFPHEVGGHGYDFDSGITGCCIVMENGTRSGIFTRVGPKIEIDTNDYSSGGSLYLDSDGRFENYHPNRFNQKHIPKMPAKWGIDSINADYFYWIITNSGDAVGCPLHVIDSENK